MNHIPILKLSDLPKESQQIINFQNTKVLILHYDDQITAIGNACLHKGGPLGKGIITKHSEGLCIQCPWHGWEYNIKTGKAPDGYLDQQSVYDVKIHDDQILLSEQPIVRAKRAEHDHSAIKVLKALQYQTTIDSINILGISTTNMAKGAARESTSEHALLQSLEHAEQHHSASTRLLKLRDLEFRACEGYYSIHEQACTWPCSITDANPNDGMTEVYRSMILWADVILVATPIRWGNPSSLYFKMCERLNCVQNQITLHNKILIQNKVAGFIITGGQDNIQQVAGQMGTFFTDLGFVLPPFHFVGWSRGWVAEDMEKNVEQLKKSRYLKRSVKDLTDNAIRLSKQIKQMDSSHMNTPLPKRIESDI
jgi:nitrite reductase/ring-hydroxylating ferredoxin subunit/multimeric flavodoxin WrbA